MRYKIGDKVRVVESWNAYTNQNDEGLMDHWLGKVMTIRDTQCNRYYYMEEDVDENGGTGWGWNEFCIAGLASDIQLAKKETLKSVRVSDASVMSASFLRELLSCFKNPVISFNVMISNGSDEDQHES